MIPVDQRPRHRAELRLFARGVARSLAIIVAWLVLGAICLRCVLYVTW